MNTNPNYQQGQLHWDGVSLANLAETYGTPLYVYSRRTLETAFRSYDDALAGMPHLICYAVKANGNLAILNTLARLGAGFDVVSGGELARVIAAGGDPRQVVFSGVGKTAEEIRYALAQDLVFNVESEAEFDLLAELARRSGRTARISVRINPNVDPHTHPYIATGLKENKFGVTPKTARTIYRQAAALPFVDIIGVDAHIGSQITTLSPFLKAFERLLAFVDELAAEGIAVSHLDIGGGLGVSYRDETPPTPAEYLHALRQRLGSRRLTLVVEPGRSLVAQAGLLLTRVLRLKRTPVKNFAIVDAGMNDLLRPSLYGAWHPIQAVTQREGKPERWDIVGPICESGDFIGKDRTLHLQTGDLLAVGLSGAYGFALSSNYNARPRAAEVMLSKGQAFLVRQRESIADLWRGESLLPKKSHNLIYP